MPTPNSLAKGQLPSGSNPSGLKNDRGSSGDTHLGEVPKPVEYQRFYKPGEGPPLEIRDARYTTFRLPSEILGGGNEGKVVADSSRPVATAAYTNAPLKEQRLPVSPDETQLVPPRYRDSIQ